MKTIKIIIGILFFAVTATQAQVSVNVNIGTPPPPVVVVESPKVVIAQPPAWGPAGYNNVEYYYLPDIEVYFDVRLSQFIYFGGGKWIRASHLPSHCRNYNLYNGYKVVLADYHGKTPYTHFKTHKAKYYKGYKGKPQKNRGEYHEHHDNGNHHGNDKHKHDKHGKEKH